MERWEKEETYADSSVDALASWRRGAEDNFR
jgi:hypothetical protein